MDVSNIGKEEQQLAALAERIQALESELKTAQAQLIVEHSRLLFERHSLYTDASTVNTLRTSAALSRGSVPLTEEKPDPIHIEPLPIHHPLRRKWNLGKGVTLNNEDIRQQHICFTERQSPNGKMRLFGLLADGEPWEHYIPFSMLARDGGILIGRDPESVDLMLPETGVSRVHARIELGTTGLVISDMNSTNGLEVNDQHINTYSPRVSIYDGSTIRLGETALRVEIVYNTSESSPQQQTT